MVIERKQDRNSIYVLVGSRTGTQYMYWQEAGQELDISIDRKQDRNSMYV